MIDKLNILKLIQNTSLGKYHETKTTAKIVNVTHGAVLDPIHKQFCTLYKYPILMVTMAFVCLFLVIFICLNMSRSMVKSARCYSLLAVALFFLKFYFIVFFICG